MVTHVRVQQTIGFIISCVMQVHSFAAQHPFIHRVGWIAFYRDRPGFVAVDGLQQLEQVTEALMAGIVRAAGR